jgi:hypothetical protein
VLCAPDPVQADAAGVGRVPVRGGEGADCDGLQHTQDASSQPEPARHGRYTAVPAGRHAQGTALTHHLIHLG